MKVKSFNVEEWMDAHEKSALYNIAETCCSSISIKTLLDMSSQPIDALNLFDIEKRQDYGEIRGLPSLKSTLAGLYSVKVGSPLPADNVLITSGAISANYLIFYALVGEGDHVICHYPTYQQLYSVPESFGAEVDLWRARSESKWELDIEQLKQLLKPNTKLIVLNNPHNPTGSIIPKKTLEQIIEIASERKIIIMSDEVYRPIFHGIGPMDETFPSSILSMGYENVVATGSLSKAYALAGIRVGWLASRSRKIIEKCASARHYTTISVSELDQQVASFALSQLVIHGLISRNIQLAKKNLDILQKFVSSRRECEWVKPVAGTTAFVKFSRDGKPVNSEEFCKRLLESTGVLFVPGEKCFGPEFKGYVRIGFVARTEVVSDGFERLEKFMSSEFHDVPLAE